FAPGVNAAAGKRSGVTEPGVPTWFASRRMIEMRSFGPSGALLSAMCASPVKFPGNPPHPGRTGRIPRLAAVDAGNPQTLADIRVERHVEPHAMRARVEIAVLPHADSQRDLGQPATH